MYAAAAAAVVHIVSLLHPKATTGAVPAAGVNTLPGAHQLLLTPLTATALRLLRLLPVSLTAVCNPLWLLLLTLYGVCVLTGPRTQIHSLPLCKAHPSTTCICTALSQTSWKAVLWQP